MNIPKKGIDLIPGKLYRILWNFGFPAWKPKGYDFVHDVYLDKRSVIMYTGVIKTDIFRIQYYEFLYMGRLTYIATPSKEYNILEEITDL